MRNFFQGLISALQVVSFVNPCPAYSVYIICFDKLGMKIFCCHDKFNIGHLSRTKRTSICLRKSFKYRIEDDLILLYVKFPLSHNLQKSKIKIKTD